MEQEHKISSAERRPPWTSIIAVFAIFLCIGLVPKLFSYAELRSSVSRTRKAEIEVTVVHPSAIADAELALPGDVQSIADTTVSARSSGYLKRRLVDIGDSVRQGQLLAIIWSPETDQDLLAARAQLVKSKAGTGQAQADLASKQAAWMQARAGVAHAVAAVAQMNANYHTAVANLRKSEHAMQGARSQQKLTEITYKRYKELFGQGFVTSQDLDTTRTANETAQSALRVAQADVVASQSLVAAAQQNLLAAEADLQSARQNVEAAAANVRSSQMNIEAQLADNQANVANVEKSQVLRDYERVLAPFDGVITARYVDEGALIKADNSGGVTASTASSTLTALFGMARTDVMRILASVPQTYVADLHPGEAVDVLVREYPGHPFSGTVTRKSGGLDAATRTQQIEVHIHNKNQMLKSGMYATVHFRQKVSKGVVRLVSTAFIIDAKGTRVALVQAGHRVHLQPVEIGRDFGNEMEVRTGLSVSDTVVDNPAEEISEGEPVREAAAPPPKKL